MSIQLHPRLPICLGTAAPAIDGAAGAARRYVVSATPQPRDIAQFNGFQPAGGPIR